MVDTTADRILFRIKTRGAQTTADLASAFSITTEAARQLLVKLEAEGLVSAEDRKAGRGRPKRLWHMTEAGNARFPDRHSDLSLGLIQAVRAEFGEEGLDRLILRREADQLSSYLEVVGAAAGLTERVAALAAIRDREGYMAEYRAEPDGSLTLIENHCPICAAAASCQNLCRSELEIFRKVLGPGVSVERTDHMIAGARRCAYRIEPVV
jgi:predicted ArsR family transcriptional regulator